MSKSNAHHEWLPPQATAALGELGANLALARVRRKESRHAWAQRMNVSTRTVQRMESGDPGVGMGIYATALWLMGRAGALPELADPSLDHGALEQNLSEAKARLARASRSRP